MAELSVIEQIKQRLEISDPIKFFKHVKILDATTEQILQYEMWPHLEYFIRAIYKWQLVIVLKAKQIGVSWTIGGVARHKCYGTGVNIVEISKGEAEAADLLAKSTFIDGKLPTHLQLKKDKDGIFLVHYEKTHSRIHTLPSTENAGLGETGSIVFGDENEFHPYAERNWTHLEPLISAGGHCVKVSTADPTKVDSHFKKKWRGAREGMGNFYPIEGVNLMVNEGEVPGPNGFFPIFMGYDCRPGRDEEWYRNTEKNYDKQWEFRANYPRTEEEALSPEIGRTVFDPAALQGMQQNAIKEIEIRQGVIHIFLRPELGVQYMAGVDMAEGRGGDYSVLWIEGMKGVRRELYAVIHTNQILIDTFAFMAYEFLKEYYNPRIIGGATPYEQEFYSNLLALGYDRGKIYSSDKKREKLGYQESGGKGDKRAQLLLWIEPTIRGNYQIHYIPAIKEFFAFQLGENSRMEAAEGSHDDLVTAACKANFGFREYKYSNQGIKVTYSNTWRG